MHQLTQWSQADSVDPYNPNQIIRQPDNTWGPNMTGGVSLFPYNKVPTTVKNLEGLRGLAGSFSFTTLSPGVQLLLITGLSAVIGFFGMKYVGPHLGFKKRAA